MTMGERDFRQVIDNALKGVGRQLDLQVDLSDNKIFHIQEVVGCLRRSYYDRTDPIEKKQKNFHNYLSGLFRKSEFGSKTGEFDLNDLKLKDQQDLLKELFDNAIPATTQDVVLVFNTALGTKDGRYVQEIYTTRVYAEELLGQERSAIQISTAAGICAVVDLVREKKLPQSGFVRQEEISLNDFLANRFGQYYSKGESV